HMVDRAPRTLYHQSLDEPLVYTLSAVGLSWIEPTKFKIRHRRMGEQLPNKTTYECELVPLSHRRCDIDIHMIISKVSVLIFASSSAYLSYGGELSLSVNIVRVLRQAALNLPF